MNAKTLARLAVLALALIAGPADARHSQAQTHGEAASFDCARASTRAERLICGDSELARADRWLGETYATLLRHSAETARAGIRQEQRAWLMRREACADRACLLALYDTRDGRLHAALDARDAELRRELSRIGQCQATVIESIGPRLEGSDVPNESGTSVSFANGVYQVSYDLERPVARSRVGDRVRVCLASIPRHCPPGDDRGREYDVTNLRTGERWRMPDSQHMCGGA